MPADPKSQATGEPAIVADTHPAVSSEPAGADRVEVAAAADPAPDIPALLEKVTAEAAELRRIIDAGERPELKSVPAEVLYASRDPYAHRVFSDRGAQIHAGRERCLIGGHGEAVEMRQCGDLEGDGLAHGPRP